MKLKQFLQTLVPTYESLGIGIKWAIYLAVALCIGYVVVVLFPYIIMALVGLVVLSLVGKAVPHVPEWGTWLKKELTTLKNNDTKDGPDYHI